jgi:replication initiation protein RepC
MTLGMLASQAMGKTIKSSNPVDKWKLYRSLCEARTRLGISDRALTVMNALLSFYPKNELAEENGLIVFPSNAQLSLRAHGMAEQTIRRHLAVLIDAGLLSRKDSANGKRYARRNGQGSINDAFGFSLAPLLARAKEIELAAAEVVAEKIEIQRLRERLTICKRDISKLIETASLEGAAGDWQRIHDLFRSLVDSMPRKPTLNYLTAILDKMTILRDEVINQLEIHIKSEKPSGNHSQNERHIQNTEPESIIEYEPAAEKHRSDNQPVRPEDKKQPVKTFPLSLVLKACPEIAIYGPGGSVSNWRDLMTASIVVRTMLGVSTSAYEDACMALGQENAAVVMACILERHAQINSAGGYLRDLTKRAQQGGFSLGPMLMALIRTKGVIDRKTG